jgi:hypothetical protein
MKISKKLFIEVIKSIQNQDREDDELGRAMGKYTGSFVVFGDTLIREALMNLLKEVTGDTYDYIGWWLYEGVEKKVWLEDGRELNLKTAGKLYDFLANSPEFEGIKN